MLAFFVTEKLAINREEGGIVIGVDPITIVVFQFNSKLFGLVYTGFIPIYAKPDPVPTDPNVIWDEVKLRSVPELPGGVTSCDNEANIIEHALDSTPKTTDQTAALEAGDDLEKVSIQGVPIADLTGFKPGDNPQKSVGDSLQDQGYIENGAIKLSDNQQIILFEIGKTETSNSGFDAQDNIVLVTTESL